MSGNLEMIYTSYWHVCGPDTRLIFYCWLVSLGRIMINSSTGWLLYQYMIQDNQIFLTQYDDLLYNLCYRDELTSQSVVVAHRLLLTHWPLGCMQVIVQGYFYTPTQRSCGGYIGFTPSVCQSICPSVRPTSRVHSVVPTVLVGSIWYLHILSSNFRRCVMCKENWIFGIFLKFVTLTMSSFDLIWCESLPWVNIGRRGVSQNAGVLVVLVQTRFTNWYLGHFRQIGLSLGRQQPCGC